MTELPLVVPRQLAARSPMLDLREKVVRQWVGEIPVLNLPRSVKALLETVTAFNREPVPAAERLKLLEIYRPPVVSITQFYDSQRVRQFPLSTAQRQQIRDDVGKLSFELANGYKVALLELLGAGGAARKDPAIHLALYRAIEQIAFGLVHAYRIYSATPANAYIELYALYGFAETHALQDAPLVAPVAEKSYTPSLLVRRLLLVSASDPFRLSDGDVARLFSSLEPYTGNAALLPAGAIQPPQGRFVVPLAEDIAPYACARLQGATPPGAHRILDTKPVIAAIERDIERLTIQHKPAQTEELQTLLRLLEATQAGIQNRSSPRTPVAREVAVACDLPTLHFILSGHAAEVLEDMRSDRYGITVRASEEGQEGGHHVEHWAVVNESASGLLLRRVQSSGADLVVGGLIGVFADRDTLATDSLTLATVRWMKRNDAGALEAGVELLRADSAPVTCRGAGKSHAALYCKAIEDLKLPPTLILDRSAHAPGEAIEVDTGKQVYQVVMGPAIHHTPHWVRFGFALNRR